MNNKPASNTTQRDLKPAEGWLNLTLVAADGTIIGKIGGVPLDDKNPLHAAINAAQGEFDPSQCSIEFSWNSGTPKHNPGDFAQFFKKK
jgi:hypothetical protein